MDTTQTTNPGQARAKVGGEIGANGEWYEGGKFIATRDNAKRAAAERKAMGRKWEIAPFEYATPPSPTARAIFGQLAFFCFDRSTNTFGEMVGTPDAPAEQIAKWHALRDAFNAGARWFTP